MYYPGWLLAYFLASVLASHFGVPYPLALLLIFATWYLRDRIDPSLWLRRIFAGSGMGDARRLAEINPHDADAQCQVGTLLFEGKKYAEAVPYLEASLARLKGSAEVQYLLGAALNRSRGGLAGEPYLRRSVEIDPVFRQREASLELGDALLSQGRNAEAYDLLRGAVPEASTSVDALHRLGVAARAAGDEAAARSAFERAKEAFRTNPRFRRRLDRAVVVKARRALGERVIGDQVILGSIVTLGLAFYVWKLLF